MYREPQLILQTADDLLHYLQSPDPTVNKFAVKSVWIESLLEEMFSETGSRFAYNDDVARRAAFELGITDGKLEWHKQHSILNTLGNVGNMLDTLVYNTQEYVRAAYQKARVEQLQREGYDVVTQELIDRAGKENKNLLLSSGKTATVKKMNGTWRACPKGSRVKYYVFEQTDAPILAKPVNKK